MKRAATIVLLILGLTTRASAHPVVQNSMEVTVARDHLEVKTKISLVEVDIAQPVGVERGPVKAGKLKAAIDEHAAYLLSHLRVLADGQHIDGKLKIITPPSGEVKWEDFEETFATYELSYPLATPPGNVRIEEDLLKEFSHLGQPWQAIFVTQSRAEPQTDWTQSLFSQDQPLEITCTLADAASPQSGPLPMDSSPRPKISHTAWQYTRHGLMHILTGYDHLLFVAALVIGASSLWDLVKVVTAFAIAHTLTLTLSVLSLVHVPSLIVEPMIAASIVFVAVQNVFFPRQARGPSRWIVAFVFGLFHGLGFAGGLLEAMKGMPATNLAVALIAFTIGVELAHQFLIVPLYFLLRWIRTPGEATTVATTPAVALPMPLRLASVAISIAGMYYLIGSLRP